MGLIQFAVAQSPPGACIVLGRTVFLQSAAGLILSHAQSARLSNGRKRGSNRFGRGPYREGAAGASNCIRNADRQRAGIAS